MKNGTDRNTQPGRRQNRLLALIAVLLLVSLALRYL